MESVDIQREATTLRERAKVYAITTNAEFEGAGGLLVGIKALMKEIATFCEPNISRWHEGHKAAIKERDDLRKPLVDAEWFLKSKMGDYRNKVRELEAAERSRLEAIARKEADERRAAEIAAAKESGDKMSARMLAKAPVTVAPVAPAVEVPKAKGVAFKKKWKYRIRDEALIKREYMIPNEQAIRVTVERLGPTAAKMVGGIEIYEEEIVSAGGGR